MVRRRIFWGLILVLAGVLFLLNTMGVLSFNVWGVIWPLFLILLGAQFMFGRYFNRQALESEQVSIPLEGTTQARISLNHGAGQVRVTAGADPNTLMSGTFSGGVSQDISRDGNRSRLTLNAPTDMVWMFPFGSNRGFEWDLRLNENVAIDLEIKTGASETILDLSRLKVERLNVGTGASSTRITLPEAAGFTRAEIGSGAASVDVRVPQGVAARIRVKGGLSSSKIDQNRFPRTGDFYESPDYSTASNRADIEIDMGVGSVTVS